jgi:dTDP-4-dehydrorhamnose reductase
VVPEESVVVAPIKIPGEVKGSDVLILGAFGMLGHALQAVFPGAILKGRDLDITDQALVSSFIRDQTPKIVINSAGYTNVDGCEDEPEHAFAVNGMALAHIATACQQTRATLVHYSTDYIFDGSKQEYIESDAPNPISLYGQSKLLGEEMIREHMDDYRIIRTSWLFGRHGKNFVDTILQLSGQMETVKVVTNQVGRPTYAVDLAEKTPDIIGREPGIYHVTNDGTCSWFEFARAFIPNAVPCTTEEFPRRAKRPRYSVLTSTKMPPMRHWREALAAYLKTKEV